MSKISRNVVARCPLCHEFMETQFVPRRLSIQKATWIPATFVYFCRKDRVFCKTDDPLVGKWESHRTKEKIPCPNPACGKSDCRIFFNSAGYMKAKCVKCGATVETRNIDMDFMPPALKVSEGQDVEQAQKEGTA